MEKYLKEREEILKQNFSMDDNFGLDLGPDAEAVVNMLKRK